MVDFHGPAGFNRVKPFDHHGIGVVRMNDVDPSQPLQILQLPAQIVQQALGRVFIGAVRRVYHDHAGDALSNKMKLALPRLKRLLRALRTILHALERYGFFRKLGLFPVEQETARGASQFLRYATRVASTPNSVLWLTPQGRFADPRVRPLVFKDGMAALLTRLPRVTVVPLAIEYAYWDERLPEVLMNWGEPIRNNGGDIRSKEMWNATITAGLSRAQDELAALAATRDAARFDTLLEGKAGIGLIYDVWRRIRSRYQGKSYDAEHASIRRP